MEYKKIRIDVYLRKNTKAIKTHLAIKPNMKHTLTLTQDDYLTHQLYESSTNPLRSSKRKRDYIVLVICGIICTIASSSGDKPIFIIVATISAAVIIFGKTYLRQKYKNHFARHVVLTYKGFFNEPLEIEITADTILMSEKTGESTVKISEIKQVSEIPDHFLITISTGATLIIPKTSPSFNQEIREMARREHILFLNELNWKWR